MKKILVLFMLFVLGISLIGCSEEGPKKYSLNVIDNFDYLASPLEKEYEAGEEIIVHLVFLSGPANGIQLNGEKINSIESVDGTIVKFNMPNKDSILYTTRNGYIARECKDGEHVWDEGMLKTVPGSMDEEMLFTCTLCGKTKTEFVQSGPRVHLTVTGDANLIQNGLEGDYPVYNHMTLTYEALSDKDIIVTLDDVRISKSIYDNQWFYDFELSNVDAVLNITTIAVTYQKVIDLFGGLSENEIISSVRYERGYCGVAPGTLIKIQYSEDTEDMKTIFDLLNSKVYEDTSNNWQIAGGGYVKYTVEIGNSIDDAIREETIKIVNGYITIGDKHYKYTGNNATFEYPSKEVNSFLTYQLNYNVYAIDDDDNDENDIKLGTINYLLDFEFKETTDVIEGNEHCYILTSFGKIYILNDNHFMFDGKYYEVTNNRSLLDYVKESE